MTPTLLAAAALAGLAIVVFAGLKAWADWLALQRLTLEQGHGRGESAGSGGASGARIELADLRERVRKLEAIASGVDP